jgi:S-DNA-T family DNA segregation ATPase FtsK/SpoIIIE
MEYRTVTARRRSADSIDLRIPVDVTMERISEMAIRVLGWDGMALDAIEQCGGRFRLDMRRTAAQIDLRDGARLIFTPSAAPGMRRGEDAFAAPMPPTLGGPPVTIAHDELLGGALELASPPAAPTPPRLAWPSLVLPALFGVGSLVATLAHSAAGNRTMNMMTTGYMLLSAATLFLNHRRERRAWSQAMHKRERDYTQYLEHQRERLRAAAAQQLVLATEADPDPARAAQRTAHFRGIWTRDSASGLYARIGVGRAPLQVQVKPPRYEPLLQPDPLGDAALALCAESRDVIGMPLHIDVAAAPRIGLAGPRTFLAGAARALISNLARQYSPQRLRIAAFFSPVENDDWAWMRWLPHARFEDGAERALACDGGGAARVVERLAATFDERRRRGVHTLLVLADERLCADDPRALRLLNEAGMSCSTLYFAARREALPRAAHCFIEYEGGRARLHRPGTPPVHVDAPDFATTSDCDDAARSLAALPEVRAANVAAIPAFLPLLDLWGVHDAAQVDIESAWRSAVHLDEESLRVPIGRGAGGALLYIDLRDGDRGHGAHGLVAGTTGAGKSELLQTLVASLAARFRPDWLAFLLIDYKGGGMAGAFRSELDGAVVELPHIAGVMTNLVDSGSARRALIALDSELKRRQRVFDENGVTYIDAYQKKFANDVSGRLPPMPRLVIIVDEFAELKRDQPEFMKQLVSAARIGRSLGVHLILATQKPSGVVDEQIWSNSRFKLCLRVQDEGDSKEMLKRPDAAHLKNAGRAFFLVGSDERFEEFQSAYGGARHLPELDGDAENRFVAPVLLDGRADASRAIYAAPRAVVPAALPTQLHALVQHVNRVGRAVRPAERIWLDPLPTALAWDDVRLIDGASGDGNLRAVLGLLDEPRVRRQSPLVIDLARDGHALIYGQGGSGKSMLLLRMVMALARAHSPAQLEITVLDFGSRSLRPLEALPHVGDVLTEDDEERIGRLFRMLKREMSRRKALLDGRKIGELRRSDPAAAPPARVLIIDNYPAFARMEQDDALAAIVRDGPALGIHVVLTANKPLDVRTRISGNIATVLCLQQADRGDYSVLVGRTNGLEPLPAPGRGLVRTSAGPLEFQAALPCVGGDDAARAQEIQQEGMRMRAAWGDRPTARAVPVMPEVLALRDLPPCVGAWPAIGLQTIDLDPLMLPLHEAQHLAVTGTPGSGKSTLLRTIAYALIGTTATVYAFAAPGDEPVPAAETFADEAACATMLDRIDAALSSWRAAWQTAHAADPTLTQSTFAAQQTPIVVLIDDADVLAKSLARPLRERLDALLDRGVRGWPVHFVLAGSDRGLDPMDGWIKRVKDAGGWIVLGGLQSVGFGLRLPASERDRPLPPGHGYVLTRRSPRAIRFRAAEPNEAAA